jgi:hypothetical protein
VHLHLPAMTDREKIAAAISNFPFWDYGMGSITEISDREWVEDLANFIAEALA